MLHSIKAEIDVGGRVRLLEPVYLGRTCRAIVTLLENEPLITEGCLLSESALSDWSRPEEDEAWSHLQERPDSEPLSCNF